MKIVISGTSRGIGKKIAIHLSKKNHVIGLSRTKVHNKKYKSFICDINNYNKIQSTFKLIGKFDVLINCAGISYYSNDKVVNFENIIKTNLTAPFYTSTVALNYIKNSRNPSIINISSINGYMAFPNNPAYVTSKGGLISLTRALANDFGKFKIRVNSISPGYIKEGMTLKSYQNKKKKKIRENRTMLERWGNAKDLFGIIDYLISKKSKYVTSQDFVVDGGWIFKGL